MRSDILPPMESEESTKFYELTATDSQGNTVEFSTFRGLVLIIANVASLCSLTKRNYVNLAEVLEEHYDSGLRVLLFPCNQFKNQEPGEIDKIREKVETYSDKFILFDKVDVHGENMHPVFEHLTKYKPRKLWGAVEWNFTKFLVDASGHTVERFLPTTTISKDNKTLVECMKGVKTGKESEEEKTETQDVEGRVRQRNAG